MDMPVLRTISRASRYSWPGLTANVGVGRRTDALLAVLVLGRETTKPVSPPFVAETLQWRIVDGVGGHV